jgi:hypothetical protein
MSSCSFFGRLRNHFVHGPRAPAHVTANNVMSLYGNLFRFRPSAKRATLEDFLSVALADLMNRMPVEDMANMTSALFVPEEASALWREYLLSNAHAKLSWRTHRTITVGRKSYYPDLTLESANGPLLIIENKIAAPFSHANASRTSSARSRLPVTFSRDKLHQLAVYGHWLTKQCRGKEWKGALATLTYLTVPPDDFRTGSRKYGVHLPATCRWPQVWRWLTRHCGSNPPGTGLQVPVWKTLGAELADFIEDHGMSAEKMTVVDLDALVEFLPHADRVGIAFNEIYVIIKPRLSKLTAGVRQRKNSKFPDAFVGVVRDEARFESQLLKGWYIEWGICSRTASWRDTLAMRGVTVPGGTFAYVTIWTDGAQRMSLRTIPRRPASWAVAELEDEKTGEFGLVAAKLLTDFNSDAERLTNEIGHWIADELENITPVLPEFKRRAQGGKLNRRTTAS